MRPAESGFVRCRGDRSLYRQALTSRDRGYRRPPVANLCSVVLGFGGRPPEESYAGSPGRPEEVDRQGGPHETRAGRGLAKRVRAGLDK